jgi:hypothetical protein
LSSPRLPWGCRSVLQEVLIYKQLKIWNMINWYFEVAHDTHPMRDFESRISRSLDFSVSLSRHSQFYLVVLADRSPVFRSTTPVRPTCHVSCLPRKPVRPIHRGHKSRQSFIQPAKNTCPPLPAHPAHHRPHLTQPALNEGIRQIEEQTNRGKSFEET